MRAGSAGTTGGRVGVVLAKPAAEELKKQYYRLCDGYKNKIREFLADFIASPWSDGSSFRLPLTGYRAERVLSPGFQICFHYEQGNPIVVVAVSFPLIM